MKIDAIELLALKKLALVNNALALSLSDRAAAREQRALTKVLVDVIGRAELENGKVAE
jgi:hypothetical protein